MSKKIFVFVIAFLQLSGFVIINSYAEIEGRIPQCYKFMGIGCDTSPVPMERICSPKDLAEGKSGNQCTTWVETDEHYFQTKIIPVISGFIIKIVIIVISILLISKFIRKRNQRKIQTILHHNKMIDEYKKNHKLDKNSLSDINSKKHMISNICRRCNADLPENAKFCAKCGTKCIDS